jgi:hypothetical protein
MQEEQTGAAPDVVSRLASGAIGFAAAEPLLADAARAAAGFDDLGDPSYRPGLRALLEAYDREAKLKPAGRAMVAGELVGVLRNRLAVERALAARPAIREIGIRRPIFVLGLPRTGTTALHHLLAQDPANQVLEFWLAAAPKPRPPRGTWAGDPAFQESERFLEAMYEADPSLKAIHWMTADGPEECRHLLQQTFTDDTFECNATIPGYSAWYARQDMLAAYARHRDVLKLVGSTAPEKRWVLKYPAHLRHLRALLATYPDACVVQTHRDPARVLPSLASLITGWRGLYEDAPDGRTIGGWQLELWASTMEDAMSVRRARPEAHAFDLHFREIVADPAGAIARLYAHFGFALSDDAARRMRAWHAENPQGKHGEHRYDAEAFGLGAGRVHDRFAAYMRHFAVEREAAA